MTLVSVNAFSLVDTCSRKRRKIRRKNMVEGDKTIPSVASRSGKESHHGVPIRLNAILSAVNLYVVSRHHELAFVNEPLILKLTV